METGTLRKISASFSLLFLLAAASVGSAQNSQPVHELFPYTGFYAPDRFQNSLNFGVRYEYHFERRLSFGATLGFASAGQDYFQQLGLPAPEQGSSTVIYYNGRVTHSRPIGSVIPYVTAGLGVTRQHSESNLTLSIGIGTKFPIGKTTYLRYEINDHIFSSGQGNNSWTNNNIEVALGVSFFLR